MAWQQWKTPIFPALEGLCTLEICLYRDLFIKRGFSTPRCDCFITNL